MNQQLGLFTTFSGLQLITANSTFPAAMDRIRKDTLDDDIPDRMAHEIMLLGTRRIYQEHGVKLEPMTVGRFKDLIIAEFGVKPQSVDNDIIRLKKEKIIAVTKGVLPDGRESVISLTDVGAILYALLGQRLACLILALAELLKAQGPVPINPGKMIEGFIKDYSVPVRRQTNRTQKPK